MTVGPFKEIEDTLRKSARDPFLFTELVDTWNAVFDAGDAKNPEPNDFDTVIDETFQAIASEGTGHVISPRMRHMINALPHIAIVVRADGLVAAMNEAALERLPCDPGDQVTKMGYALEHGEDLSAVISGALDRRNSNSDVIMKLAAHEKDDRRATLAIVPSIDDGFARALVFVIDPVWREEVQGLLSRAYNLTTAELEILMAFLEGRNLKDIAASRNRSFTTVRTQFQTILNKAGAATQAELMRNTIAVSQFFTDIGNVADVARHPNRRRFDMLCEGGRSVDVTLTGDMRGPLVISIPDATQFLFPARVEEAFKAAGLCVAFLCRPGTGQTDPALDGQDYIDCLAEDVTALLDHLKKKKAVLLTNNMSSVFVYPLGSIIPDLISRMVITSTLVPGPQFDGSNTRSPWARALMRAVRQAPGMYKVMIHSAIKAWKAMGSRRMYLLQLKGFAPDVGKGSRPEVVEAYDAAMRSTLAQGTDTALLSFEYAAKDWTSWIDDCQVPIELVQGHHDPSSSYAGIERFAALHPDKITLHGIEDAGYLTFLTHTDLMLEKLVQFARK